jgi:hypothetical protein
MARAGRAFYPSIGAPTHKADIHAAWLPTNDWKPSQPRTSPIRWFRIRSYIPSRRTLQPPQSLNIGTRSSAQHDKGEMVMSKILVLGAAALAVSAAAASAQTYMTPGYGYAPYGYGYAATAPLYDYAAPAYGYAAPAFGYEYGGTPPAIAQNPPPSGGYPPPAVGAAGNPATYAPLEPARSREHRSREQRSREHLDQVFNQQPQAPFISSRQVLRQVRGQEAQIVHRAPHAKLFMQAKHIIPGCTVGQEAAATCACGTGASGGPLLCQTGQWCHYPFANLCTQ